MLDIRTIFLPQEFLRGISLLVARELKMEYGPQKHRHKIAQNEASAFIQKRVGSAPTFGAISSITQRDITHGPETIKPPTQYVRSLVSLLNIITPWTPVCGECGEFPLSVRGGKVKQLDVGALCPCCDAGIVQLVPILLRRLHWVTGELVDPSMTDDYTTKAGVRIPIVDHTILEWVGGDDQIHQKVWQALQESGLSLYGMLAYFNVCECMLARPEDAAHMLRDLNPSSRQIEKAKRFVCQHEVWNVPQARYLPDGTLIGDQPILQMGTEQIVLTDKLAQGSKSDVYRGCLMGPRATRVIVKVIAASSDVDLLVRESDNLTHLTNSDAAGSELFKQTVPENHQFGVVKCPNGKNREALIYRDKHGFDWTLVDILKEYPNGIHPRHMVWIGKRIFLLLSWIHDSGLVHGAILPEHVLVHPVDHMISLLDWSYADHNGHARRAMPLGRDEFYSIVDLHKDLLDIQLDIAMTCRCLIALLGGQLQDGKLPREVPDPFVKFLQSHARYESVTRNDFTALEMHNRLGAIGGEVYGPRQYVNLVLPNPESKGEN